MVQKPNLRQSKSQKRTKIRKSNAVEFTSFSLSNLHVKCAIVKNVFLLPCWQTCEYERKWSWVNALLIAIYWFFTFWLVGLKIKLCQVGLGGVV